MRLFEVTAWNDPFPGITMIRNSLLLISLTSLAKASANDIFFLSTNDKTYSQSLETTMEWSTKSAIVESNSKQEIEMLMETIKCKRRVLVYKGCSSSTATHNVTAKILIIHELNVRILEKIRR